MEEKQQGEGIKVSPDMLADNPKSACGNVSDEAINPHSMDNWLHATECDR